MADWKEQSLRLWRNIGKRDKYIISASALALFFAIILWSYWWGGRSEYVPLFTNMEVKDAGDVAAKLKELKIPYEISEKGATILVSAKDVYRIRLELATQGLPRGKKGFEIFEQNKFGSTDFQNKVNLLQALQGELSRTIEQLEEVETARVHIVLPEDSLYKNKEKPASASIMLKLRPSIQLSQGQINGIVNLVAHSIPGLRAENITVVDNYAKVLNETNSVQKLGLNTGDALAQLQLTKKISDELQHNVESMLEQVLGPGKAAARVSVELNFDQHSIDRQIFEPVIDERGIIRSSQEKNESYKGVGQKPSGPAGTASNIPGYVANNDTSSSYDKKEVTKNYEISEVKEKTVSAPGSIKRLSIAVFIDAELTAEQQSSITKVVSSAVGFNASRGDTISVERIRFSKDLPDKMQRDRQMQSANQEKTIYWLKISVAVIAVLALLFVLWIVIRRILQTHEEDLEVVTYPTVNGTVQSKVNESDDSATMDIDKKSIVSPEEKERQRQKDTIENLARTKPETVAQLLKTWLSED